MEVVIRGHVGNFIAGVYIIHANWYLILLKFCKHEDIIRKYNPMMDLSKFTFNFKKKKVLSGVVTLVHNQVFVINLFPINFNI